MAAVFLPIVRRAKGSENFRTVPKVPVNGKDVLEGVNDVSVPPYFVSKGRACCGSG